MAEQDELQIRIGLSVANAEKVQTTARAAETRTTVVEQKVRRLETEISSAERRSNAIERKVLKMGVGFAVGSLLETGLDAIIPTDDQNAISTLARISKNVAVPALMSPNPIGITLALLSGAITAIQEDIRLLDAQINESKQDILEFRERSKKDREDFEAKLRNIADKSDERIQKLVDRGYVELKSGL